MIEIKETRAEDLENLRSLWGDGDVMKFVGFPEGLKQTPEEMERWLLRLNEHRPRVNHYSIYEDDKYCGETYYNVNPETKRAALDVKLFAFARGRGIASKALRFVIEQAFSHGAESAFVDPNPENAKALALYRRLGMMEKPIPPELKDPEFEQVYFEIKKP